MRDASLTKQSWIISNLGCFQCITLSMRMLRNWNKNMPVSGTGYSQLETVRLISRRLTKDCLCIKVRCECPVQDGSPRDTQVPCNLTLRHARQRATPPTARHSQAQSLSSSAMQWRMTLQQDAPLNLVIRRPNIRTQNTVWLCSLERLNG